MIYPLVVFQGLGPLRLYIRLYTNFYQPASAKIQKKTVGFFGLRKSHRFCWGFTPWNVATSQTAGGAKSLLFLRWGAAAAVAAFEKRDSSPGSDFVRIIQSKIQNLKQKSIKGNQLVTHFFAKNVHQPIKTKKRAIRIY